MIVLPTSLIIIRNRPSKGGYVCPESEFQTLSFLVLRRKPCCYWYFTIVFVFLFSVAVAVSIHLSVLCRHFCCTMSQFQSMFVLFVAISAALSRCFKASMFCLSKFSPTGPQESGQNKCNQRKPTEGWSYTKLYCCMGLMSLKSENKQRSVKIRRYH